MGLGVLEDHHLEHVPGTVIISDKAQNLNVDGAKHSTGRDADIVLVPQPSNDPNDPLNWPQWKKEMCMVIISGAALMGTVIYCTILPAELILSDYFDQSLTQVSLATGSHVMGIGCITFFVCAATKKWGKRPVFLFSAIGLCLTCIWGAASQSWASFFAARVFQGFCVSAFEIIVPSAVSDIYFV